MTTDSTQHTQPSAPPTPENNGSRRRSWFGLSSPSASTSSPRKTSMPEVQIGNDNGEEVLELSEVGQSVRPMYDPTQTPRPSSIAKSDTDAARPEADDWGMSTAKKPTKKSSSSEIFALRDLSTASRLTPSESTPTQTKMFRRPFGRTASDRDVFPPGAALEESDPQPGLHPEHRPHQGHFRSPSKPLPPLPDVDRIPREIVVTPSSPRNPSHLVGQSFDDIGLGKPPSPLNSQPPSLPAKQSVSSPLPARAPSPTPRVSFGSNTPRGRSSSRDGGSKAEKEKRARSLSGMFIRPENPPSQPREDDPSAASENEQGRSQGMLGWLGVRKTIKRRPSDIKLKSNEVNLNALDDAIPGSVERRPQSLDTNNAPNSSRELLPTPTSSFVLPPVEASSPLWISPQDRYTTSPTAELGEPAYASPDQWSSPARPWIDSTGESHRSSVSSVSSPLESLPEAAIAQPSPGPPEPLDMAKGATQERRLRSWSDAPILAPPAYRTESPPLPSPPLRHTQSPLMRASTPPRPYLASRNNSGSSVVMEKVRNVFSKNSRSRSNSLLRYDGDVDEFGLHPEPPSAQSTQMRTSSSSSSITSPVLPPVRIRHDTTSHEDTQSPRSSYTASISSRAAESSKPIPVNQPAARRARASTISSMHGSAAPRPASPSLMPAMGTPPRNRPGSLRRMSNGLFKAGSSPKMGGSLFPLPPRSSGSISSSGGMSPREDSIFSNSGMSPRPSVGSLPGANGSINTTPLPDETPEAWVQRLSSMNRRELAGILAASGDQFYIEALKTYMQRFDFTHSSLDISLRRLLMHMSLPRETQQIDRVIEAFAKRYDECEPGLFQTDDNSYVLAFSMMMLHTDAFNRNNKNKMTKADYVRNTRLDGVPPIVLESFFDNITFTPFVFIEDEGEFRQQEFGIPGAAMTTSTIKSTKIDVYDLIVKGRISALRVDVERWIPAETPFSCTGTQVALELDGYHKSFAQAHTLQITPNRPRRKSSVAALSRDKTITGRPTTLRITKVGIVSRKDDNPTAGKRPGVRKWKSWSVILTGSQLVFFKDTTWALSLLEQIRNVIDTDDKGQKVLPRMSTFKPDEVFSLQGCIAVFDRHYNKYPNTFRFVTPLGQHFLMQASDEADMNHWLGLINYASTFKTANIHMRAVGMGSDQAVLAGAAAAAAHRREVETGGGNNTTNVPRTSISQIDAPNAQPPSKLSSKLDVAGTEDIARHSSEQLEAVFGVVKAELAAGRGGATKTADDINHAERVIGEPPASRREVVMSQLDLWKTATAAAEKRLSSNLRMARNLAILTPFQKTTRDRIEGALPQIARDIRNDRMLLAKLRVWSSILQDDFEWEQRDWARLRHVALQAAATSLRSAKGVKDVERKVSGAESTVPIPRLDLPMSEKEWDVHESPNKERPGAPRRSSEGYGPTPYHFEHSSTSDLDESYDPRRRPSSEYMSASSMLSPEDEIGETQGQLEEDEVVPEEAMLPNQSEAGVEEAEEWQNTRAAKRVSLATIPPDELRELSHKMTYLDTVADDQEK